MGINAKLKPCLHILFSSSLPGYSVSEKEEENIIDHVLLLNGVTENDSSRMTREIATNHTDLLWGVFCLVLLYLSDKIVHYDFQLLHILPILV